MPKTIRDSKDWFDERRKELFAISEDHENGLMHGMVTLTQNDRSPELLAAARDRLWASNTSATLRRGEPASYVGGFSEADQDCDRLSPARSSRLPWG